MLTIFNKKPFYNKKWTTNFWVDNMRKIQEMYKPYTIEINKSNEFFDSKYKLVFKLPRDNNPPPIGFLLFLSISSVLFYFYNSNKSIKNNS